MSGDTVLEQPKEGHFVDPKHQMFSRCLRIVVSLARKLFANLTLLCDLYDIYA